MTADAVGGVWNYALELAHALEGHGVEIALAVMGPSPTALQRAEAGNLPNVVLHESGHALEWMDDPWEEVERAGEWLLRLAGHFEPDAIHLNGYVHAALPWPAPVLVVAHSCVFSWWSAVRGEPVPDRCEEYRRRVQRGLAGADRVIAPSAAMLRSLEVHYGEFTPAEVIYNAREPGDFLPAAKAPQIFAAGRAWDDAKNLGLLDEAAPEVHWPIDLAGDRHHPNGQDAGYAHVRSLGKLDAVRMRAYLAESAIYALPARYEPFGLSVLEAALCGCALVLGDIASLREIWGDAALFVDPDDKNGLVHVLNTLSEDHSLRAEMARRARERALRYTPARMAEQYLAAYRCCWEGIAAEGAAAVPTAPKRDVPALHTERTFA